MRRNGLLPQGLRRSSERGRGCLALGLVLLLVVSTLGGEEKSDVRSFLDRLKQGLQSKDLPVYLSLYRPQLRQQEKARISSMFADLKMEAASVYLPSRWKEQAQKAEVFVQVMFENPYSVIIETWHLILQQEEGEWAVVEKSVSGSLGNLFKISIPSDRIERARSVEIEYMDIHITFREALVFYDNIPEFDTAMIVVGKGRLSYSPSVDREKHQLEMVFKRPRLEDDIEYVYLRFSQNTMSSKIRIDRQPGGEASVTEGERRKAYSLFVKHYSRSFTMTNSLNGQLLSSLPQGDEMVIDFAGKKHGEFTYIYSPFAEEEISFFQWEGSRIVNLYSPAIGQSGKKLFISFDEMFDIRTCTVEVDLDPNTRRLSGKARLDFESRMRSLSRLKLDLSSQLEILRVQDEAKNSLLFAQDKLRNLLYIYFFRPLSRNEMGSVEIYYRGKLDPPVQMSDVIIGPQYRDGGITLISPPRFDTHLYSRTASWYPGPTEDDYFQARIKVIVPPKYTVIANGRLVGKSVLNGLDQVEDLEKVGRSVFDFETEKPVKYLAFIAGEFDLVKETGSAPPIQNYRTTDVFRHSLNFTEESGDIVRFYESLFGPFPYEKLALVNRIWLTSGGHSPASFIVLNQLPQHPGIGRFIEKNSPVNLSRYSEYYVAHEIAHQWWGQAISAGTYRDQWLSEGMAQFAAVLYLRHKHGQAAFSSILKKFSRWTEKKSDWGQITLGARLSYFDFEAYQTIVYDKSTLALIMLGDIMGEDEFLAGLREFCRRFMYSSARTRDFFKVMQEYSGPDLEPFFSQWFESHRLPHVQVSHSLEKEGAGYRLNFDIAQIGETFVFPLWIGWEEDGRARREKAVVDIRAMTFGFSLENKPTKIKVNPDDTVPGRFR